MYCSFVFSRTCFIDNTVKLSYFFSLRSSMWCVNKFCMIVSMWVPLILLQRICYTSHNVCFTIYNPFFFYKDVAFLSLKKPIVLDKFFHLNYWKYFAIYSNYFLLLWFTGNIYIYITLSLIIFKIPISLF